MRLLVLTDFSKLSKVAVDYAGKMAKSLKAELFLLHVVYLDAPPRTYGALISRQVIDKMINNAKQDFELLIRDIRKDFGIRFKIHHKIVEGNPLDAVVESFALDHEIDLIIMGTKGASGFLLGSNAATVISNSSVPVLTVPEHSRFNGINEIICASELQHSSAEIKALVPFVRLFNAHIHVIHAASYTSRRKFNTALLKKELVTKSKYKHISVEVIRHEDVTVALNEAIANTKADLLVMFTHKLNFFEKIFGRSVTRQMAFHTWTPLLTIKKKK